MNLIDVRQAFAPDEQCLAYLRIESWPDAVRYPICEARKSPKSRARLPAGTNVPRFVSA